MSSLVQTLAPPAPVASPTETICRCRGRRCLRRTCRRRRRCWRSTTATTGPRYAASQRCSVRVADGQVLRVLLAEVERECGRASPVGEVGPVAVRFGHFDHGRRRAAARNGPARSALVVNSCRSRSAASMTPPGLERRSMIEPLAGQLAQDPATSSTNRLACVHVEGPDPQVPEGAVPGRDAAARRWRRRSVVRSSRSPSRPAGGDVRSLLPQLGGEQQLAGPTGGLAGDVDRPAGAEHDQVVGGDGLVGLDRAPLEPDRAVGLVGGSVGAGSRRRPRARPAGAGSASGRWVMVSSARARRASGRPPVRVSAYRSTARAKGTPFQVVSRAPAANPASLTPSVILVTTYVGER